MANHRSFADANLDLGNVETRGTTSLDTRIAFAGSETSTEPESVQDNERDTPSCEPLEPTSVRTLVPMDPSVGRSESRWDPITGDWTIFASGRAFRPDHSGSVLTPEAALAECPFCAGREDQTPEAVWSGAVPASHGCASPPWSVRVVPNLYPAVMRSSPIELSTSATDSPKIQTGLAIQRGMFLSEAAVGGHEVIIESARHTRSFSDLNPAEIALVFQAYADRIRHWRQVPGIRYINVFKNVGRDAGASLPHGHSQLVATNQLPTNIDRVTKRFQAHHARTGSCLQCDIVRAEIKHRSRVICQTPSLVAYCPFASRFPLLVRITSLKHLPHFEDAGELLLAEISHLTLRVVRWLEAIRPETAYNVLLYTTPPGFNGDLDSQHWALEVLPRITRMAGYELSSHGMINPIYPEAAAVSYREQAKKSDPRHALK